MTSHQTGATAGVRLGNPVVRHSFPVTFGMAPTKFLRIQASPAKPIVISLGFVVNKTAFNGTSPQISIGSSATAPGPADIFPLTNIAVPTLNGVSSTLGTRSVTSDMDLYVQQPLAAGATTGEGCVILDVTELNVSRN